MKKWGVKKTKTSIHKIQLKNKKRHRTIPCMMVFIICSYPVLSGCVNVLPQQQRLVSKANMQFSGSVVFGYQDRLLSQFESGSASFIGGQSGNCGSCSAGGAR